MKSFEIPNALSIQATTGNIIQLTDLKLKVLTSISGIFKACAEILILAFVFVVCISVSSSVGPSERCISSHENITAAITEAASGRFNSSLDMDGLVVPPLISWKHLNSGSGFEPSVTSVARLKNNLGTGCSSCESVAFRSEVCNVSLVPGYEVESLLMYIPDLSSNWLPPIATVKEIRNAITTSHSLSALSYLRIENVSCFSTIDILMVSQMNQTIFIDLIRLIYLTDLQFHHYSISASQELHPDASGVFSVIIASGAVLSNVLFLFLNIPVPLLTHLFTVSLACCTYFKLYLALSKVLLDVLDQLEKLAPTSPEYEPVMCSLIRWVQWAVFVRWVEIFTVLAYLLRMFTYARSLIIFLQVFSILFIGTAYLGSLAIGDAGLKNTSSLFDFIFLQFQMISSQWPDSKFWEPARHARPLLFSVWAFVNGLLLFCVLYCFFQAVLESSFSRRSWITCGWKEIFQIGFSDILKIRHKLSKCTESRISEAKLCKLVGTLLFENLKRAGFIHFVNPESPLDSTESIRTDSVHADFANMINQTLQVIRALKSRREKIGIEANSSTVIRITDTNLMEAVQSSFSHVDEQ